MIDFEAVIHHFGQKALDDLAQNWKKHDDTAFLILADKDKMPSSRCEGIRNWLQTYQVFQGFSGEARLTIAAAVLKWADARDLQRDLTTIHALVTAHEEVMCVCVQANGEKRDFTSLASKALWLCYPNSVPIFDSFVRRALLVMSKLETNIVPLSKPTSEYHQFIHIWKALYEQCHTPLNEIELGDYPYRMRIFDKILWLIGSRHYGSTGSPNPIEVGPNLPVQQETDAD